jgi:HK97 family phage prohead protease
LSILHRTAEHLRADTTGRTVYGLAVPYGVETEVSDGIGHTYRERFAPGAFQRSIQHRSGKVRLFVGHEQRKLPIGRATELREAPDGLHVAFVIADTREGAEILGLVRDGIVDSFSIGFRPVTDRQERGVVVRTEAALIEVSLVGIPAYEGATVAGIRSQTPASITSAAALRRLAIRPDWI